MLASRYGGHWLDPVPGLAGVCGNAEQAVRLRALNVRRLNTGWAPERTVPSTVEQVEAGLQGPNAEGALGQLQGILTVNFK